MKYVSSKKILNLIIVVMIDNTPKVLGFNPYFETYFEDLTTKNMFQNKVNNINGHVLTLLQTRDDDPTKVIEMTIDNKTVYSGKDSHILLNFLKYINANYIVVNVHKIYYLKNPWRMFNKGKGLDRLKGPIIQKHNADILMDAQELKKDNYLEFIYPHAKDDYVIVLSKSKKVSQLTELMRLIKNGFGYIIILFAIVCPLIWYGLVYIETKISTLTLTNQDTLALKLLNNLRLVLGSSLYCTSNRSTENMFILCLLYCNLIINSYFQSILSCILTISEHDPELDSVPDVINSGIKIYAWQGIIDESSVVLKATGHPELLKQFIPMVESQIPLKIKNVPVDPRKAITSNYDRAELVASLRPFAHIVKESLIPTFQAFQTVQGSPYYDVLNDYISRIIEAGLFNMWKRMTLHQYILYVGGPQFDDEEVKEAYKSISFEQFKVSFYFLLIGLSLSYMVFIIEIIFFRVKVK